MSSTFDENLIIKYLPESKHKEALKKLASGYPVQYIIGNVEFYGSKILVNENVLIPRFETEYFVSDVLKLLKEYKFNNPKIIDIGTGSGCIAISLKKNYSCKIKAIDNSYRALNVARKNAKLNNVQISFSLQDICEYNNKVKYDVLVSNPPYVPYNSKVDSKIKYEPKEAIYAKENGLYFYKVILEKSTFMLNKKNIIAFEIGDNQAQLIINIAKKYYPNAKYISKKDLNKYDRYLYIINE